MNKAHITFFRQTLDRIPTGEQRPFFFIVDGPRKLLHVLNKVGTVSMIDSIAEINKLLKPEWDGPVANTAKLGAGMCSRVGKKLYFHDIKYVNGATIRQLQEVHRDLKVKLALPEAILGEAPPVVADEDTGPARDLWIEIEMLSDALQQSALETSTEAVERLKVALWEYEKADGLQDISERRKMVEAELVRRRLHVDTLKELKAAFTQAEDSVMDDLADLNDEEKNGPIRERFAKILETLDALGQKLDALTQSPDIDTREAAEQQKIDVRVFHGVVTELLKLEGTDARNIAQKTMKEWVEDQVQAKSGTSVTHREDVGAVSSKERKRLASLKLVAVERETKRLQRLEAESLDHLDEDAQKQVREELRAARELLERGAEVLRAEVAARGKLIGATKAMAQVQQAHPWAYHQANEVADVPLEQISRHLLKVEELTIASTPAAAAVLLRDAVKGLGLSVAPATGTNGQRVIRIGSHLDIDLDALGDEGARKVLILLRSISATPSGQALLKGFEDAGLSVTIEDAPDPEEPFFSEDLVGSDEYKTENRKTRRERKAQAKELRKEYAELQRAPWWNDRMELYVEWQRLSDELRELQANNDPGEAAKQIEVDTKHQECLDYDRLNPEAATGLTRALSIDEMLPDLESSPAWSIEKSTSKVAFATSGPGAEMVKEFGYAGLKGHLPEDAVLFHELTHSLNSARGKSLAHLGDDRFLNKEERQTVDAEGRYMEEIGYKWRRLSYDDALSPIDSRTDTDLPEERQKALREMFDRDRTSD